jgi:pimeloyl-ACP methyl ester carboxylesterase
LYTTANKPPILWVRGSHDIAVSDRAASDAGTFGLLGLIEGYPGEAVYPPQPMVSQIRRTLERYAESGGSFEEVVIDDSGHIPFIEKPDAFNAIFHEFLARSGEFI